MSALAARLRAMMAERPAWYRAILTGLAARLDGAAVPLALRAGDTMPDFVLPDPADNLVSSVALRRQGPLVVCFVRGGWCPFCSETLAALNQIISRIEAAGGTLLALAPETHGYGAALHARLGLRFRLLADVDCGVALQFGAAYRVPVDYHDALRHFGVDLAGRLGDGPGLLPMPATFVCDPDGIIRFATISGDITERADPATIAECVEAMRMV